MHMTFYFQVYTGHKSILPWLSFPDKFKSRVSSVPVLHHLSKLLLKLPKLVPASGWSARWFLDFPLCCVLGSVPSVSSRVDPKSLAPKYLVSNICFWKRLFRVSITFNKFWNTPFLNNYISTTRLHPSHIQVILDTSVSDLQHILISALCLPF